MIIEFNKSEWQFTINGVIVTLRWRYLGRVPIGVYNCKQYEVSCIIYNNGSGLLNVVCETKFITSLQPNYKNSLDYLKRILKNN